MQSNSRACKDPRTQVECSIVRLRGFRVYYIILDNSIPWSIFDTLECSHETLIKPDEESETKTPSTSY